MAAVAFAVLSAFGYAWLNVLTQMGLRGACTSPFTALFINLAGGTAALLVAVPLLGGLPETGVNWTGVLYFAAAGLIAALVGQAANFAAIHRIGATRTASFVMADNVFAAMLAFIVLGQSVSLLTGLGILVLMAAAAAFIRETSGPSANGTTTHVAVANGPGPAVAVANGPIPAGAAGPADGASAGHRSQARMGIVLALVSALCFASAGVFRGLGVAALPSAVLGAAIGNVAALVVIVAAYAIMGRLREPFAVGRRSAIFLLLSGVASALGTSGFILALQYGGTIAISTALKNTSPLFTFALAMIFLRRHDRLSVRVGVLVAAVVLGGVLAALGRG